MMPFRTHLSRTLVLGLPLVGSQLAQILIGLTDTLMLGRYSAEALAAGALATTVFHALYILAAGFAIAAMGMASDAAGRGDERMVRRTARMGLWLSVGAGAVMAVPMWFSQDLLLAAGQEAGVASDTGGYLRIAVLGLVPALATMSLRSHLSALERTRIVLGATVIAALVNVVANWMLIFGNGGAPEMGVRGAAVASVIAHGGTLVVLALYAAKGPGMARWELFRNLHVMDGEILRRLFGLGWPVGLTLVSESALFSGTALMMGAMGSVPLAAHGIAMQVTATTFMVQLGLSQAGTVRVGRFAGAGDRMALRRAAGAALALSGVFVAVSMAALLGAGEEIVGAFLDPDDPATAAILPLGVTLLALSAAFQLADAGQVMMLGFLRGLQDTRMPLVLAALAYWGVGVPVCLALGFGIPGVRDGLGPPGVWLGMVIGLGVAATLLTGRFLRLSGTADSSSCDAIGVSREG